MVKYLIGVATVALIAPGVAAQTLPAQAAVTGSADPVVADPTAAPTDDQAGSSGDVVVLGFGQSRQVQTITAADLDRLTPGTSPLKAISKLPGVNFQASDPFGAYEWSTRISLRGFNQNQLGFTLDGVPLGDMSYGPTNGLHISRAIISENIASTSVAQGAGALGTASTSNLGGTIQFTSRAPSETAGIAASGTYGSNDTIRAFVRADSGDLGGGLKGYLSYAYLTTDKWKGFGSQRQHQANAKIVKDFGDRGSITGFFNFSDRRENDYQDLSLDIIKRRGFYNDNISNDYPLAVQFAKIYSNQNAAAAYLNANGSLNGFSAPYASLGLSYPQNVGLDDGYYDAAGLRRDYLGGITFDAKLTDSLSLTSTSYYHRNKGQGSWITPYNPTQLGAPNADGTPITNPAPLTFRTTEYSLDRAGTIAKLALTTGANKLELTGWYESNTLHQARRLYGMTDTATPNRNALDFQSNPMSTTWNGKYDTETLQYSVGDTLDIGQLTINGGWKGMRVRNQANVLAGTLARGRIKSQDWFLPQIGVVLHLGNQAEVFASYTENMRAFIAAATAPPFSIPQVAFNAVANTVRPEKSKTAEGGVRYRTGGLQLSAVGYYIDFSDRLLTYSIGTAIQGLPPTLNNVGGVESYGAEVSAFYRLTPAFSALASYSYNHATYQQTVRDGSGNLLAEKGRYVVDTPQNMVKGELVYDDSRFFGRVGADYMSKRYYTYLNDQSVEGRVLVDASIGYRFPAEWGGFSIEGSVTNLTDKRYISTIGSGGFVASDPQGRLMTLLAGAPRQWFVTLKKGF
ncbi:TonB-dependent receptor [Sphingomonas sp. GM_Shp_1]|uniref:TonB-dependent receptor n=1 Tax=Sphingomonas sp. GM_Shp_1 TaxID=2937381 RepID=UPI00226B1834|nr:TonB-dependent receptor [Sphingomonas sp. GM_Shp_1]